MDTAAFPGCFEADVRSDGGYFAAPGPHPVPCGAGASFLTETLQTIRRRCRDTGGAYFIHFTEKRCGAAYFAAIRFSAEGRIEQDLFYLEQQADAAHILFRFSCSRGCARIDIVCT